MGRWTFQDGKPLYIPDPGEEGGGSTLGHAAMGAATTLADAWGALTGNPVVQGGMNALGLPFRAVGAVGHSMQEGGYKGTSDPIEYILSGEKTGNPADLASYGDLLADTMEAEGTIREGSGASKVIRLGGDMAQDPIVLLGLANLAVKPMNRPPGLGNRSIEPRSNLRWTERFKDSPRQKPPKGTGQKVPVSAEAGPTPRVRPNEPVGETPELMTFGESPKPTRARGPRMTPAKPRTEYRQPPIDPEDAARSPSAPLDRDMASPGAFTTGGTKELGAGGKPPRGAKAARQAERRGRAREMGRQEQLDEGTALMRREQMTPPRSVIGEFLQAAVENGASVDDVMNLLLNLGG